MAITYDKDIIAWANEQAALLRAGNFSAIDIEHIAEEIEDVGKSEQRELESRMSVLLAYLMKWQVQPLRRSASWQRTIREQRKRIALALRKTPSLSRSLQDAEWMEAVWSDAVTQAINETGLDSFTETCPWTNAQVLSTEWLPDSE